MAPIYIDFETYSYADLLKHGTRNYAQTAEVTLCAWAIGDTPVRVWQPALGEPIPPVLYDALADDATVVIAHNAYFDRNVAHFTNIFGVDLPISRWYCTMVQALAHSLPGSLATLSEIFGLGADKAKDKEGKALVRFFCKPDKDGIRNDQASHPEKWAKFGEYCRLDVEAMRAIHKAIPKHNYPLDPKHPERQLWFMDQAMNDRGFQVDLELARSALVVATRLKGQQDEAIFSDTDGAVTSATKVADLKAYMLSAFGVDLPNMQASTIERRLADPDLPQELKDLLAMRAETSKTSVSKYKKLVDCADGRGRLTGTIQFAGAGRTGRDAGRTFQPQNLPRPPHWFDDETAERAIAECKAGTIDLTEDKPMVLLGAALRGAIIPAQGHKLVISDLSNIEGRKLVWLSGEEWKLQYFRGFDAGIMPYDNYVMAYAKAMGLSAADAVPFRQTGKVMELGCGFGGGVGAFLTFAKVYNMDLDKLAVATEANADTAMWHECLRKYEWALKKKMDNGLQRDVWAACEYNKLAWRQGHPATAQWWADCEAGFRSAVAEPNAWHVAGRVRFKRVGQWLYAQLPSGRVICYLQPKVDETGCTYMGMNQYTRQWSRLKTYGGKLAENFTQASARDVFFGRQPAVEAAGYNIILRVHDELITEVPNLPQYSADELSTLMATQLDWCQTLPLAAKGFETTTRYKKD